MAVRAVVLTRLAALAALVALVAGACSPTTAPAASFVGAYLADNRPHELIYLELSGSDRSLAGVLTLVTVDDELGPRTDRFDVRGAAERDRASLVADRFMGQERAPVVVARAGSEATLTVPSFTGEPVALPARPAAPDELERLAAAWGADWEGRRRRREADAAREATARRETEALARVVGELRVGARRLRALTDDARAALLDDQIAVQRLTGFVLRLKRDAERDGPDLDARCSPTYRRRVEADATTLNAAFAERRTKLGEALDRLEAEVATARRSAALARERLRLVDAAGGVAPSLPRPDAGAPSLAPGDAEAAIEAHATALEAARRDLAALRASDRELRGQAQDLAREGRAALDTIPSDAECRATPPEATG